MSRTSVPINAISRAAERYASSLAEVAGEVLRSGHYVLGPRVEQFEAEFANYVGVPHCVGVANGTDALELALRALGVGSGDRVAVVANAAMYGTGAVLAVGAEPLFVDVDAATGLMTPASLAAALAREGGARVAAVIVTHLYGRLADMAGLMAAAEKCGIRVVEDCAQAHGARSARGELAGGFGDIGTFSFYPTKNLGAVGDGGA
ncbi:MAG: DegT/DnrJ/EryC1/StrS family aminotransferase, partial [Luteimonas sp.]